MSDAGEELNEIAVELERHALQLPRPLAAMVLAVAAARIACDAPRVEREGIVAHHRRGWDGTMADCAARDQGAKACDGSTSSRNGTKRR